MKNKIEKIQVVLDEELELYSILFDGEVILECLEETDLDESIDWIINKYQPEEYK